MQGDTYSGQIVDTIGRLYGLEKEYEKELLAPDQIKACRNSLRTKEILIELRSQLDVQLADDHPPRGELMDKAVRYLDNYWDQIFKYLNDGIQHRQQRCRTPHTPFGGEAQELPVLRQPQDGEWRRRVPHACLHLPRHWNIRALLSQKALFSELARGNRDYRSLLPQTISLS